MKFFIEFDEKTRLSTFTTCVAEQCAKRNCQRHPNHNPDPASEANLYLDCDDYEKVIFLSDGKEEEQNGETMANDG